MNARYIVTAALAFAGACQAALPAASAASAAVGAGAHWIDGSLPARIDQLESDGFDRPEDAVAGLESLKRTASDIQTTRMLLKSIGTVDALSGRVGEAESIVQALEALTATGRPDADSIAAANLVRAELADINDQSTSVISLADASLPVLEAACGTSDRPSAAACDYRAVWRAHQLLSLQSSVVGAGVLALRHARDMLHVAETAGDDDRQARSLLRLVRLESKAGHAAVAQDLLDQARRAAARAPTRATRVLVADGEALLAEAAGNPDGMLRAREHSVQLARDAQSPRLEAHALTNLSDAYLTLRRPADALNAANQGLRTARAHHDLLAERILVNNAGVAKIGLHRLAEAKLDLALLDERWRHSGDIAHQAESLREFGQALAAAGDAADALDLYHRERALSAELLQRERRSAIAELQKVDDADAQQRRIALMTRTNALKNAEIRNRDLRQRIWQGVTLVFACGGIVVGLLYRRVSRINRRLAANEIELRLQSERDPLTQLANRRHLHAVVAERGVFADFRGGLLMIDIDHFKRINDQHGHPAGDQVLEAVAQLLRHALRDDDVIVRWGGEEFVVLLAPTVSAQPTLTARMARRVLKAFADAPIVAGGAALPVTCSIGHGTFPLEGQQGAISWESAVGRVDAALYAAKHGGRNRAAGLVADGSDALDMQAGPQPESRPVAVA